jgi:hypothetical protein
VADFTIRLAPTERASDPIPQWGLETGLLDVFHEARVVV